MQTRGAAGRAAPEPGETAISEPKIPSATATCAECGETKPLSAFGKDKSRTCGLRSNCRPCLAKKNKEWRNTPGNHERKRAVRQAWRLRVRMEGLRHYGGVCACCGEAGIRFLTFDHIDGGGRQHLKETGPLLAYWLRKNNYPGGFQILCFNCNSGRSVNGGACPHQDPDGRVIC